MGEECENVKMGEIWECEFRRQNNEEKQCSCFS